MKIKIGIIHLCTSCHPEFISGSETQQMLKQVQHDNLGVSGGIVPKIIKHFVLTFCALLLFSLSASAAKPYKITEYKKGIYIIEINTKNKKCGLIPFAAEGLEYNSEIYKQQKALLSVNAGFFDPVNQKTVSYMVLNGKTVLDPRENENLMNNEHLKPYLDKILNRTEFRIFEGEKGRKIYDIAPHNAPMLPYKLLHSIQAGPMVYPELRLEEEFFILVKDGEIVSRAASSLKPYARMGIGIKNNKVYIIAVSKEAALTLEELGKLAGGFGLEKAMAFDGGGSVSLDTEELHLTADYDNEGRKVKSFLILKKAGRR